MSSEASSAVATSTNSRRAWIAILIAIIGISAAYLAAARWVATRIGPPFRIEIINPTVSPPNPVLRVTCCRQMEEIVFIHIRGTVENVGTRPLKNVLAHARFFDRIGKQVASAQALITSPELIPGDDPVAFQVTTPVNLAIASASIDFRQPGGPPLPVAFRNYDFKTPNDD